MSNKVMPPDRASDTDAISALSVNGALPLSSREVFWRAKFLRESAYLPHLPFLFWLVGDLRPGQTVTLGVGDGVAHFALCQAVEKMALDTACHGIGIWKAAAGEEPQIPRNIANYNEEQYGDFSRIHYGDMTDRVALFDEGSVDLLLVDRPLSENLLAGVEREWVPRLSSRAIMVLRDTDKIITDPACRDRISAFRKAYPNMAFDYGGGLIAFQVGDDMSSGFARLAMGGSDGAGRRAVHQVFWRLGGMHENEWRVRAKTAQTEALTQSLSESSKGRDRAQTALDDLSKELQTLQKAYEERGRMIAELQSEKFDLAEEKHRFVKDLKTAEVGKAEVVGEVEEIRATRSKAEEDLKTVQNARDTLERECSDLQERLRSEREEAEARLAKASQAMAEQETQSANTIRHLEARVQDIQADRDAEQSRMAATHKVQVAQFAAALEERSVEIGTLTQKLDAQIETAKQARQALEGQLSKAGAVRDADAAHIAELTAANARLNDDAIACDAQLAELTAAQKKRFREIAILTQQLDADAEAANQVRLALESQLSEADTRQRADAARLVELTTTCARLGDELAARNGQVSELTAAQGERFQEITTLIHDLESATHDMKTLEADHARTKAVLAKQTGRGKAMERKITEREAWLSKAEEALAELRDEAGTVAKVLEGRSAEIATLTAARDDARDKATGLKKQVTALSAERDELTTRLGDFLDSTSWKITGPVRRIGALVKKSDA